MTDLATKPGADEAPRDAVPGADSAPPSGYAWAPAEAPARRRRTGLWIGVGAAVTAMGLVAASLVLIAPGTSIAGVGVGGMTAGAAADAVSQRLADTVVVLTGDGGDAEFTGADLGASVDARGLADDAFAQHPMWNPGQWFREPSDAAITLDAEVADSALRAAAPELYVAPVDATLVYDSSEVRYVTTPAEDGVGVDLDAVRAALQQAFDDGVTRVEVAATPAPLAPLVTTGAAEETAATLNGIIEKAGFYIDDERVVPVKPATAASWLSVSQTPEGTFEISADAAAIEKVVGTLAKSVDREPVDARVITDSSGSVLRTEVEGVTGRELGSTDGIAADYAAQLAEGEAVFDLPVTETDFATTAIARRIEVNLSSQRTYLFENGEVTRAYAISSGLPDTPTTTGSYRIFAHVPIQDMGCFENAPYCTEDVPWVTYFNGDQAFHGAYWHNNFGTQMSHGCVNMPVDVAKYLYDWAPTGTEVWVHY
ncbi:L,D-transpeptidase family protein [Microbacterium aureliae]